MRTRVGIGRHDITSVWVKKQVAWFGWNIHRLRVDNETVTKSQLGPEYQAKEFVPTRAKP